MKGPTAVWAYPINTLPILAIGFLLIIPAFWSGISDLVSRWHEQEEYSHGYLIPLISAYLIWKRKDLLQTMEFEPSWFPVFLVALGLVISVIGELSALFLLIHFSVIFIALAMTWSLMGWGAFKHILVPLSLLFFAIPLPGFLEASLTAELQLVSTKLGVAFIRLFDISVFAEGNIIDLGNYKLRIVEACSGLRYLYPLMCVGFIAAYMYQAEFWKRTIIFLSTMPITILMNSFRIGVIGLLVEHGGIGMAEGFLHYFEGWIIFVACLAILIGEMWLLNQFGNRSESLGKIFTLPEIENKLDSEFITYPRSVARPFMVCVGLVIAAFLVVNSLDRRDEEIPDREDFLTFPSTIGKWTGEEDRLLPAITDTLALTDYVLNNYSIAGVPPINLFVAYYQSQRKGVSPHSPRVCIPGGGWSIIGLNRVRINLEDGNTIPVNRVIVENGLQRQLVYYWFKQRGRDIANEYLMKWYLLHDSLAINRTDGSLVRVSTPITAGEDLSAGDERLRQFVSEINPLLADFVPGLSPRKELQPS